MSFEKLRNFFEGRSAPLLTHLKTYQGTAEKVHDVSMQAASIVMKEAGKAARKVQVEALAVASKSSAACPYQLVLTKEIGKELVPLLQQTLGQNPAGKCCRMKTYSANESFNALVWRMCPETLFTSLCTVETAIPMSILEFNLGPQGFGTGCR